MIPFVLRKLKMVRQLLQQKLFFRETIAELFPLVLLEADGIWIRPHMAMNNNRIVVFYGF